MPWTKAHYAAIARYNTVLAVMHHKESILRQVYDALIRLHHGVAFNNTAITPQTHPNNEKVGFPFPLSNSPLLQRAKAITVGISHYAAAEWHHWFFEV